MALVDPPRRKFRYRKIIPHDLRIMTDPSFDEFVQLFRATQRCSKLAVGTPVLVRLGDDETDAGERIGFATESKRPSEPPGGKGKPLGSVTCIAKRMGAAFPDQISVGR